MPKYIWNILIWLDQGLNVLFSPILNLLLDVKLDARFGDPDETLSSVFGKNVDNCRGCLIMCKILAKFDERHCKKSIEKDEGDRSL